MQPPKRLPKGSPPELTLLRSIWLLPLLIHFRFLFRPHPVTPKSTHVTKVLLNNVCGLLAFWFRMCMFGECMFNEVFFPSNS